MTASSGLQEIVCRVKVLKDVNHMIKVLSELEAQSRSSTSITVFSAKAQGGDNLDDIDSSKRMIRIIEYSNEPI